MSKTIFRVEKNKDNPFVMIDRRPIENPNLSWRAKGVLTYLISRPDNWTVRLGDLVKRSTDGSAAIRKAVRELRDAGHIVYNVERENGRIKQWILQVHEVPLLLSDFQQVEIQQVEIRTVNDTESINENDSNGVPPNYGYDWQIAAGVKEIKAVDDKANKMRDAANLIAMGTGVLSAEIFDLALAFQQARQKVFTEDDVKGQRKAAKSMLQKGIKPAHVIEAVKKLLGDDMTVTDLYSVIKTADNIANPPPEQSGMNPQGLEIKL